MNREEFLWVEKWRPHTISDAVLPTNIKSVLQSFVDQKNIPNLLLSGSSGIGKTTAARAMLDELECDYIVVNGSLEGRQIDTLRTTIMDFASTVSFTGGRKYVIIDEADYMNPQTVQPALRNFIEEFSNNCGFILTCNYKNRIIPALHSRCSVIEFKIPKEQLNDVVKQFFKRAMYVLAQEGIEADKNTVAEVIKKFYPDWRRVLNELQKYSVNGKIDTGILSDVKSLVINDVVKLMKAKDFRGLRKWVSENSDIDSVELFQNFFDHSYEYFTKPSVAALVLLLAKYQYQSAFVANQEINTMAFFAEAMIECQFNESV